MMARETRPLIVLAGLALSSTSAISGSTTDCGRQVSSAYEKLQATKVFQFEDRFESARWGKGSRWIAFDIPRAAHRIDTRTVGGHTTKQEIIAIGAKTWTSNGDGWRETDGPGIVTFAWDRIFKMHRDREVQTFRQAECLGEMSVNGHLAVAYQAKSRFKAHVQGDTTITTACQRFYVHKESGLPLGLGQCEDPPTLQVHFHYDAGVKIGPPSAK